MTLDWSRSQEGPPSLFLTHSPNPHPRAEFLSQEEVRQRLPESKLWPPCQRRGCPKPLRLRAQHKPGYPDAAGMEAREAPCPPSTLGLVKVSISTSSCIFPFMPTCPLLPHLLPCSSRGFSKDKDLPPHTQALPQCSQCSINPWGRDDSAHTRAHSALRSSSAPRDTHRLGHSL